MSTKAKPAASSTRKVEYLPLASLTPDPANPKAHDTEVIDASVGRFGVIDNITLDGRTGFIISGHGRTKTLTAMYERGENPPDGVQVSEDGEWLVPVNTGWSSRTDTEAHAALIALNRSTELGGWVDDALLAMLDDLSADEDGLDGVGYGEDDIAALRERLDALDEGAGSDDDDDDADGDGRAPSTGEMLALADVSWGEPTRKVHHGEVWRVGRHILIVAKVHDEHGLWTPWLARMARDGEVLFAPYPEPFLTTGSTAEARSLLMVQPNTYLAGHLLDKHASVFPDESVEKIA